MKYKAVVAIAIFCSLLSACDDGANFAPVTEVSTIDAIPRSGAHRVTSGETLYEIAWRYGLDYRTLAATNHINPPYTVKVGQVVYLRKSVSPRSGVAWTRSLRPGSAVIEAYKTRTQTARPGYSGAMERPAVKPKVIVDNREPDFSTSTWGWPAKGKVIRTYSGMNKGINIAGAIGDAVYASAPGKVVYCGDGLRGYGNLVIIKHNSQYLSAYAHNSAVFVKEGAWVKQGQIIAEIGKSGSSKSMLHFEIRRAGKPVDPMPLLKA